MNSVKADRSARCGEFVRGYFVFLQGKGIASAVLHDWQDGFEHELSDVDHVIDPAAFPDVTALVHEYCAAVGWRLCQVLRHETTAAYCVCSAGDDPACAVALDACSDYRRNGSVLMKAGELLEGRETLPGGGCRLSAVSELKYRFIKAAAKSKKAAEIGPELAAYPDEVRSDCARWLEGCWGFTLAGWDTPALEEAFAWLYAKTCRPLGFLALDSLTRVVRRILQPTGLVVMLDPRSDTALAGTLCEIFGHLYFRKNSRVAGLGAKETLKLVRSTLLVSPRGGAAWWVPARCLVRVRTVDTAEAIDSVASFLHVRCVREEGLESYS